MGIGLSFYYSYCFVAWTRTKLQIIKNHIGIPANREQLIKFWEKKYFINQTAIFMSGSLFRANLLDESLNYVMEWDQWIRITENQKFHHFPLKIGKFRVHTNSKTFRTHSLPYNPFVRERILVTKKYWGSWFGERCSFWLSYLAS